MSLVKPHPLWTTLKASPFEVNKSVLVARLLSGLYRSDWHTRHWSTTNKDGFCLLCPQKNIPGDIDHLLVQCEALSDKRDLLFKFWDNQSDDSPSLSTLLKNIRSSTTKEFMQFVLDPSVVPMVISGVQNNLFTLDKVFSLTRTFCYGIHQRRLLLLGRHNYFK